MHAARPAAFLLLFLMPAACSSPTAEGSPRGATEDTAPGGRGAGLMAELGCGGCHAGAPDAELVRRRAPAFGEAGQRYSPGFLFRYLRSPRRQRSDIGRSRMPDFHLDAEESAALTLYLLDLQGTPLDEGEGPNGLRRARREAGGAIDAGRGRRIFRALNCPACHRGSDVRPWTNAPPLSAQEARSRPGWLRAWLRDPRAIRPFGYRPGTGSRMPDFRLSAAEADTLAARLLEHAPGRGGPAPGAEGADGRGPAASAAPDTARRDPSPYREAKAEALLRERLSCLGCHRLRGEGGRVAPAFDGVGRRRPAAWVAGMIRNPAAHVPGTVMPRVPLPEPRARLLTAYLVGLDGATSGARFGPPRGADAPADTDSAAGGDVGTRPGAESRSGYLSLVEHPVRSPEPHERHVGPDGGPPAGAGALYRSRCASCHGAGGNGDGYNARYLPVRPAPHASASRMSSRPDATLFDGIHAGGRILGRSHFMPPFGASLPRDRVWGLVRRIRELCRCRGPAWARDDGHPTAADPSDAPPPRRAREADRTASPDTSPGPGRWVASPGRDPDAAPLDFGPPDTTVTAADFVGAETCGRCHREQYDAWAGSTHGNAGGTPAPDTVIAPFDSDTIRFRDATVVAARSDTGGYRFTVDWDGHGTSRFPVDGVVGRGHLAGGGNQGFFTRFPDGTLRFLPFDFSRTEGRWFCNTIGRRDRGWQPTERVELADCSDWPPARVLGNLGRLDGCQECHGSQIRVRVGRGAPHFDTELESFRINCESCHGPGREHVRRARSGVVPGREDIGIRGLAATGEDASVRVCLACHALKTSLEPGYLPGRSFRAHYALKLPMLGGRPYFPDGRVRTFAYQGTHLSSQCYLGGSMTCVDCHAAHDQSYRDHTGRPLEGRFSNGQCTSCHASKAGPDLERHTHHPRGSEGSRCVACHMPYLQELQVGRQIGYARSDHTIPVPRPTFDASLALDTLRLGSACGPCHDDRSPAALARRSREWWGEPPPHDPLVRALLEADTIGDLDRASQRLLRPDEHDPMAQFQALGRLVDERLRPEMDGLPTETRTRLERLTRSSDLEVTALALAALHYSRGHDPATGRFLTARLDSLGADASAVEKRWAVVLGFLADRHRDAGEIRAALVTYRKALDIRPRRSDLHLGMGRAYAAAGDGRAALDAYRRSLDENPNRALPWVNIGLVHAARGREEAAVEAYRTALEINPHEARAYLNLGDLHLRAGRFGPAVQNYRRAIDRDRGLASAYFNLGRALVRTGRLRAARDAIVTGLEFRPDRSSARELLRRLERTLDGDRGPRGAGVRSGGPDRRGAGG